MVAFKKISFILTFIFTYKGCFMVPHKLCAPTNYYYITIQVCPPTMSMSSETYLIVVPFP